MTGGVTLRICHEGWFDMQQELNQSLVCARPAGDKASMLDAQGVNWYHSLIWCAAQRGQETPGCLNLGAYLSSGLRPCETAAKLDALLPSILDKAFRGEL